VIRTRKYFHFNRVGHQIIDHEGWTKGHYLDSLLPFYFHHQNHSWQVLIFIGKHENLFDPFFIDWETRYFDCVILSPELNVYLDFTRGFLENVNAKFKKTKQNKKKKEKRKKNKATSKKQKAKQKQNTKHKNAKCKTQNKKKKSRAEYPSKSFPIVLHRWPGNITTWLNYCSHSRSFFGARDLQSHSSGISGFEPRLRMRVGRKKKRKKWKKNLIK